MEKKPGTVGFPLARPYPIGYIPGMEYEIEKTETFHKWLKKLKDRKAVLAIAARLNRVQLGNFGDFAPVGEGVSELRIHHGSGYRLYYTIRHRKIIFMLCGGNKSTQQTDIKKAKETAKTIP